MVDKFLLLRKIAELEECFKQISEYSDLSVREYSDNWRTQRIVERTLQMMIELCVDTASHIISDESYRIPKSYADTFKVLYENGIIEEKLFEKMEKMAKFRNIVVHHYDKIDEEIVIAILRKDINDFVEYKDAIINMLKKEESA